MTSSEQADTYCNRRGTALSSRRTCPLSHRYSWTTKCGCCCQRPIGPLADWTDPQRSSPTRICSSTCTYAKKQSCPARSRAHRHHLSMLSSLSPEPLNPVSKETSRRL